MSMAMTKILSDKNCEGHADALLSALGKAGYVELLEIEMLYFQDVGVADNATDETVWFLCQRDGFSC